MYFLWLKCSNDTMKQLDSTDHFLPMKPNCKQVSWMNEWDWNPMTMKLFEQIANESWANWLSIEPWHIMRPMNDMRLGLDDAHDN